MLLKLRKGESSSGAESSTEYQLRDSIIHFGEKLRNGSPYNWEAARDTVKNADLIICLGSSLKVLKHYACLWPKKKTTSLYIVNIQWTPKDKFAKTKIHGYCDEVLRLVVKNLQMTDFPAFNINNYALHTDPIFKIAVKLTDDEINTTSKQHLSLNKKESDPKIEPSTVSTPSDINDTNEAEVKNVSSTNSWFTKSFKPRKQPSVKSEKN